MPIKTPCFLSVKRARLGQRQTEGNGQIDFPEFVQLMKDRFGALEYQAIAVKDAFQTLDKDGNGFIDYQELRVFLQDTGEEPLTEAEFQNVVEDLDVNRDGKIDYNELARKMCSVDGTA